MLVNRGLLHALGQVLGTGARLVRGGGGVQAGGDAAVLLGEVWRAATRARAAEPSEPAGEPACDCEAVDALEGGD